MHVEQLGHNQLVEIDINLHCPTKIVLSNQWSKTDWFQTTRKIKHLNWIHIIKPEINYKCFRDYTRQLIKVRKDNHEYKRQLIISSQRQPMNTTDNYKWHVLKDNPSLQETTYKKFAKTTHEYNRQLQMTCSQDNPWLQETTYSKFAKTTHETYPYRR